MPQIQIWRSAPFLYILMNDFKSDLGELEEDESASKQLAIEIDGEEYQLKQ